MKLEQIETVAVIGLGRMGHGIAQTFAVAGYDVRGFDNCAEARATVPARIRSNLADFVAAGMLDAGDVEPTLQRITVADSEADAVAGAQFVVEAIAEDLVYRHGHRRTGLAGADHEYPVERLQIVLGVTGDESGAAAGKMPPHRLVRVRGGYGLPDYPKDGPSDRFTHRRPVGYLITARFGRAL